MKKYLKVMLVLVVALSLFCTVALANPFADVVDNGKQSSSSLTGAVSGIGSSAINLVQTLGYVIAVIMVVVVGIQWLIGTPAKKQELKGRLVNVIIGALLIACGVTILGFIAKVGGEIGANDLASIELVERA